MTTKVGQTQARFEYIDIETDIKYVFQVRSDGYLWIDMRVSGQGSRLTGRPIRYNGAQLIIDWSVSPTYSEFLTAKVQQYAQRYLNNLAFV